ncbi:MAG: prolyl oligopeptidase family serine peptidase [Bacteroidetes bacterium]|nr:prolyl oligopeptidase family serine peptidase [Bacteroidota bacterium]
MLRIFNVPGFHSGSINLGKPGGIFAEAHIRGGGELGMEWYKVSYHKMNSINDIVDVAEYFVKTTIHDLLNKLLQVVVAEL